jgi:hypothetical protein
VVRPVARSPLLASKLAQAASRTADARGATGPTVPEGCVRSTTPSTSGTMVRNVGRAAPVTSSSKPRTCVAMLAVDPVALRFTTGLSPPPEELLGACGTG